MADVTDGEKKPIDLPWAIIVSTVIAVGGVFLYLNPIHTARPNERAGFHSDFDQPQDVDARLWQDALRAASEHEAYIQWKLKDSKDSSAPESKKEQEQHSDRSLAQQLHSRPCWVLAVMLPGSAYAEFGEERLRIRQAVLEGLGRNDYVPQDGEHIGYVKVNDPEWRWDNMIVPYEWCYREVLSQEGTYQLPDNVCIVWLRDEEFRKQPLAQLDCLLRHLALCGSESDAARPNVRIIGPFSSTTLRKMMEEIAGHEQGTPVLADVDMWSPTATVDDELVLKGIDKFKDYSKVEQVFSAQTHNTDSKFRSFSFRRTTRTDREIMRAVVDELQNNRCLNLYKNGKEGADRVVLISEWDTLFGRALPWSTRCALLESGITTSETFCSWSEVTGFYEAAKAWFLRTRRSELPSSRTSINLYDSSRDQCVENADLPRNVLTFSYLRGIDGMLPGAAGINETTANNEKPKASVGYELTEGLNQADYLRRLSNELVAADKCFQKNNNSIRAIGVLGGDVYDKLVVLQALRQTFRDVIFFTNNLDARLAHPDEWRWTRNLLVASPFGLTLKHGIQNVPPFRDNNQTAIYAATYLIGKGMRVEQFDSHMLGPIRLYEIGRYGAFDLTTNVSDKSLQPSSPDIQQWWTSSRGQIAIKIIVVIILGSIWISWIILGRSDSLQRLFCSSWVMFVLLGITSVIAIWKLSCSVCGQQVDAEPYSWIDGVSVWPTDTLRLLACLLSVFYIVKTSRALNKNQCELQNEFGLRGCDHARKSSIPRLKWWTMEGLRIRAGEWLGSLTVNWRPRKVNGFVEGQDLWQCYVRSGREGVRFARILPLVICYFLAGSWLFDLLHSPRGLARGLAIPWDYWLGRASAFSLVLLTFYVADATLLNRRLIDHLRRWPTKWPQKAFDKLRTRWSNDPTIPPDDLLTDYLNIELIAIRTQVVGGLIYYPFVITSLLILSRASIFDSWTWSTPLLLLIAITVAIAGFSASYLRWTAERARSHVLQRLHDSLIAQVAIGKGRHTKAQLIREATDLIKAEHRGAFAAISQRPLARALLLPSGSAGIWALFQYFPRLLAG